MLLALGAILRLIWILLVEAEPVSDALWYHEAARDLAKTGSYQKNDAPTAFFPIGYPAFLAAFYFLFGSEPMVGQFANLLLSILILFFSYQLAQKWFSERIALGSLFLLAIYPNYIAYCSLLLNELLFTAMLLGGFWAYEKLHERWKAWSSGLFWLIACHVKPWLILLPAALRFFHSRKYSWGNVGKIYVIILLFTSLWAWRNAQVMGDAAPFSTNGGINLLIGNNPYASGTYTFEGEVAAMLDSTLSETERNKEANALALSYLSRHPGKSLKRIPQKLYYLFHHGNEGFYWLKMGHTNMPAGLWRAASLSAQLLYFVILGLCAMGIIWHFLQKNPPAYSLRSALIFCGLSLLVYSIFFGYSRYHFPMIPFVCMFALTFLKAFISLFKNFQ